MEPWSLPGLRKGDIFDLTVNNIIESVNYVPDTSGWRILRDGSAEFDAAVIRGTLSAEHIDSDVRNVEVLYASSAGLRISNSSTTSFNLGSNIDLSDYDSITGTLEGYRQNSPGNLFTPFSMPVRRMFNGTSSDIPSNRGWVSLFGTGEEGSVQVRCWKNAANTIIYMRGRDGDDDCRVFTIVGVKNPVGGVNPDPPDPPDPDPDTTTVTANAGSDVSVESGGSVGVGGADTISNPVGSTTIAWTRQSGTGGSLSSMTIASPTFNAPTVTSEETQVWRKTTTNNGVSDTDDVTITVNPPGQPGETTDTDTIYRLSVSAPSAQPAGRPLRPTHRPVGKEPSLSRPTRSAFTERRGRAPIWTANSRARLLGGM